MNKLFWKCFSIRLQKIQRNFHLCMFNFSVMPGRKHKLKKRWGSDSRCELFHLFLFSNFTGRFVLKFFIYLLWLLVAPVSFPLPLPPFPCQSLSLPPAGLICQSCSWTLSSTVSGKKTKWSMWEGTGRSRTGQSMVERTLPRALCKWKHVL